MKTSDKIREAARLLGEILAASPDKSVSALRRQFGDSLIRVNWEYADAAFKNPALRHVCTWADGDEGFVAAQPEPEPENMKIHLRYDSTNQAHTRLTIFVNGRNTGQLCMSPDEADWFYLALERGCTSLSPAGLPPIELIGSGSHRPDAPIPPVPA